MKRMTFAIALCAASLLAYAHGPTRQKVTERIAIKASPDAVWDKVKDFNGMPGWHPAVESSTVTDGNNPGSVRTLTIKEFKVSWEGEGDPGSVRTLTIKGGGIEVETLEEHSDAARKFSYRAKDGGALPVSNYTSTVTVTPGGGGTFVEWRGAFYRAYLNNDPPPGQDDETAVKAITSVYQTGLQNLKQIMEK